MRSPLAFTLGLMQISKTKVDAAGASLVEASLNKLPEPREASNVVDAWRQLHADSMEWVSDLVKRRVVEPLPTARAAQRLKRKPQIVEKLKRSSTRLSQMQDIAGCRALLPDVAAVEAARARLLKNTARWYSVKDEDDYRADGRPDTGYRAVHLKLVRDERAVEVQLRTILQHAWAEAVERTGERTNFALKAGEGPPEVLDFFRAASDAFALLEHGKTVSANMRRMLRHGYSRVRSYLPADSGPVHPAQLDALHFASRSNNWLIIYNWHEARFVNWMSLGTDAEAAAERYGDYERRYPFEDGYEVVLIGADSAETIRHTHAHYFGSSPNDLDPHGFLARIL
jgi:ppGpp synthetase/RelA/SpoT-type nucleotidyltranferase